MKSMEARGIEQRLDIVLQALCDNSFQSVSRGMGAPAAGFPKHGGSEMSRLDQACMRINTDLLPSSDSCSFSSETGELAFRSPDFRHVAM